MGATPEMAHREQETTRLAFAMAVGAEAAASLGVNERRKWPIDIGSWIGSRRCTPLRDDPMHSAELGSLTQRRSVFLNHDLLVKVEFRMFLVNQNIHRHAPLYPLRLHIYSHYSQDTPRAPGCDLTAL